VANITSYGCDISWSTGSGATSYNYTLIGMVTTPTTDNAVSSGSISFNNLTEGSPYTLVIRAINSHGVSISTTSITTIAATVAPDAPTSLSSSNITTTGFTISWTGALGVSQYSYSIDGQGVFADIDNTSITLKREASFTGTIWLTSGETMALSTGTSYDFIVTATNSIGSTASDTFSVTTL
jgi:chitinase